jgi:hypothetical protein
MNKISVRKGLFLLVVFAGIFLLSACKGAEADVIEIPVQNTTRLVVDTENLSAFRVITRSNSPLTLNSTDGLEHDCEFTADDETVEVTIPAGEENAASFRLNASNTTYMMTCDNNDREETTVETNP